MTSKTKTFTNAAKENLTPEAVDVMQILVWNSCMQHTEKLKKNRISVEKLPKVACWNLSS
jgi:hypothetical protein